MLALKYVWKNLNIYFLTDFIIFKSVLKIAKCDYSFVMSVRPFVRPRETTNFHEVGYLSIFLDMSKEWKFR